MRNKKLLYNFVYYWNSLYDNGIFFGYEGKTSGIKNLLLDSFIRFIITPLFLNAKLLYPANETPIGFMKFMDNIQ